MKTNDSRKFDLLVDLAKLLKKYGKETFIELALVLDDKFFIEKIEQVLKKMPSNGKKNSSRDAEVVVKKKRETTRDALDRLAATDPEKADLLREVFASIQQRTLMPNLRDLRAYLSHRGIEASSTTSRESLARVFFKNSIELSNTGLRELLDSRVLEDAADDRALGAWGKVILKEDKKDR